MVMITIKINGIEVEQMTAKIPLQNGEYAIVDKEDYERCMEHLWRYEADPSGIKYYVKRTDTNQHLSNFILEIDTDKNTGVIRMNDDDFDYRKKNLKNVTRKQIGRFQKAVRGSSSRYKGVSWDKWNKKWKSYIRVNGKSKSLGNYDSEEEAAKAYNEYAHKVWGNDARLNVIGIDNRASTKEYRKVLTRRKKNGLKNKYRGVSEHKRKYKAVIGKKYKTVYLGLFDTPEQAAKAYDKKAYDFYGDKAILNFPEDYKD